MNYKQVRLLISILMVVAVALFFGLTTNTFFTPNNVSQLLRDAAYVGTVALGMCCVLTSGNIDLSAGGIVCFSACMCARVAHAGAPMIVCVLVAVGMGVGLGFVNGFLINHVHLTPFVATLAAGFVYTGCGLIFTFRDDKGRVTNLAVNNRGFEAIGGKIGLIYYFVIAWLIMAAILYFIEKYTTFGMHTYAMGSNENASKMSGVRLYRVKATNYIMCGGFAGIAAAFVTAYNGTATASIGSGMEFQAIAACVVGGIALEGGKGSAINAVLGGLFMSMLTNGMLKYGLNVDWQNIATGALIIIAMVFDAQFTRISSAKLRAMNS